MREEESNNVWSDDLLDRKKYARFLTKMVRRRCEPLKTGDKRRSFTMALDGDWGAGKTFFVQRWAHELRSEQLAVIEFDAWKCDSSSEPLIALIAEINKQLDPLVAKLPAATKVGATAKETWKAAISAARKIAVPAAKIVAGTAVKQLTGYGIGSIVSGDGAESGNESSKSADVVAKLSEKLSEQLEKEYEARQQSTAAFRENLEQTIQTLVDEKIVLAPLVVLIDELDRCRPDFAIRLIETVKHLFDVPGVTFVLATNTRQLSESVRAVYGNGFDAIHYLQHFFEMVYRLPAPNHFQFAKVLLDAWPDSLRTLSRHEFIYADNRRDDVLAHLFSLVSQEMGLDLRAQKRAFEVSLAAAAAIPEHVANHPLFLFFVSAVYVRHPSAWNEFWTKSVDNNEAFQRWYEHWIRKLQASLSVVQPDEFSSPFENRYSCAAVIREYRRYALMTNDEYRESLNSIASLPADSLARPLLKDMQRFGKARRCPVFDYKEFVEMAGLIA
jgi:hypothetical protein